jgi:hypothetical protein
VRRLLAGEDDVENRVKPRRAGQHPPQLALWDADGVRLLAAPVEDAGNHPAATEPPCVGGAAVLAFADLEPDPFTRHTGAGV